MLWVLFFVQLLIGGGAAHAEPADPFDIEVGIIVPPGCSVQRDHREFNKELTRLKQGIRSAPFAAGMAQFVTRRVDVILTTLDCESGASAEDAIDPRTRRAVLVRFSNGAQQRFSEKLDLFNNPRQMASVFTYEDLLQSPRAVLFYMQGLKRLLNERSKVWRSSTSGNYKLMKYQMPKFIPHWKLAGTLSTDLIHEYFFAAMNTTNGLIYASRREAYSKDLSAKLEQLKKDALAQVSQEELLGLPRNLGSEWLLPTAVEVYAQELLLEQANQEYYRALPSSPDKLVELVVDAANRFKFNLNKFDEERRMASYRKDSINWAEQSMQAFNEMVLGLYKAKVKEMDVFRGKIANPIFLLAAVTSAGLLSGPEAYTFTFTSLALFILTLDYWRQKPTDPAPSEYSFQQLTRLVNDDEARALTAVLTHDTGLQASTPLDEREPVLRQNLYSLVATTQLARQSQTPRDFCQNLLGSSNSNAPTGVRVANDGGVVQRAEDQAEAGDNDRTARRRQR